MSTNKVDRGANTLSRLRRVVQRLAQMQASGELKGDTGATGATGPAGAAATIAVGTTTTLTAGSSATVNNSGTSSAAVFNFGIPQGAKGDTGATGATGPSAVTTKGDLATFDTAVTRQPVGSDNQVLTADSTQTTGLKWVNRPRNLFVSHASSSEVANTTTSTSYGVTYTIPANSLVVGDVISIHAYGFFLTDASAVNLRNSFLVGGVTTFAPNSSAAASETAGRWSLIADLIVRSIGSSGQITAAGSYVFTSSTSQNQAVSGVTSTGSPSHFDAYNVVDTTANMTIDLKATWSAAAAGNRAWLVGMVVNKLT